MFDGAKELTEETEVKFWIHSFFRWNKLKLIKLTQYIDGVVEEVFQYFTT